MATKISERYWVCLDGPAFREQRQLLLSLRTKVTDEQRELLDGLIELTDTLADQAHGFYNIDCLLKE